MFKKLSLSLLILAGLARAICPTLTIPTDYLTVDAFRRANQAANWTATATAYNGCKDSINNGPLLRINNWTGNLQINSLQDMVFKADADNNGTNKFVWLNGNADTLVKVTEDSAAKFYGPVTFNLNPINSWLAVTKIPFQNESSPSSGMTSSSNLTYTPSTSTFATAKGTFSGTLQVTGKTTLSDSLVGTSVRLSGDILQTATDGMIYTNTIDGSDNHRSILAGGGSASNVRGASIGVRGNEYSTLGGSIDLSMGGVSGAAIRVLGGGSVVDSISNTGALVLGDSLVGIHGRLSGNLRVTGTLGVTGTSTFTGKVVGSDTIRAVGPLVSQQNIFANGSNLGFYCNTPGTYTYGMYQNGTALEFRSGSMSPWLAVNSSGQPTFVNAAVFSSTLGVTGSITGNNAASFIATGAAGTARDALSLQSSGVNRWIIRNSGGTESGSDAGSSFQVLARTDAGAGIDVPIDITRAMGGTITLARPVSMSSTLGVTGVSTFTAAPVFSSVTASQILSVNGSKSLTSTATTGTGSVMLAASPTTTGTLTAAAISASGTVTAGAVTTSGNVTADSLISSKFYSDGTFTATLTGVNATVAVTGFYTRIGKTVTLNLPPLTGTSNTNACTITGLPAALWPLSPQEFPIAEMFDNGNDYAGILFLSTSGVFTADFRNSLTAYTPIFTTSGLKGIWQTSLSYTLMQ